MAAKRKTAVEAIAPKEAKKMGFISDSLDDVEEAKAAPEGEYSLRIVSADDKFSKGGNRMIEARIAIEDSSVQAPLIRHFIMGWDDDTPDEQKRMRKLEIKRFCECFNISHDFEASDLPGQTGRSFVAQEEGQDGNIYNRLRLPRLK